MKLQQEFLLYIANEVFGDSLSEEKACFLRRFDPQYHPEKVTDKKFQTNKHIAELLKNDLPAGYCGHDKIGLTIRQTIEAISGKYKEEMSKDKVKIDALFGCNQGGTLQSAEGENRGQKFSPWQEVYKWLWEQKYPRWLEAHSWELLREKATSPANWMRFFTNEEMENLQKGTKSLILPPPPPLEPKTKPPMTVGISQDIILPPRPVPKIPPKIPANQSLWMVIDLECIDYQPYQLLLLNKSEQAERLLCPSSAYAPNPILKEKLVLLPQKDSWADLDEEKTNFKFGQLVKEEFLAIVLKQPLNLAWLTPDEGEALIEWNRDRIMNVFNHLEQSGEWQVFYQSFEVLELETADALEGEIRV